MKDPIELLKEGWSLKQIMDAVEKSVLKRLLAAYKNDENKVAVQCLMTRQGLGKKLQKHGLKKSQSLRN